MKISYNWLSKYLDHDQNPEKLGEILTNTGLEVESITSFCPLKGGLEGLVVGLVLEKEKHPNADKLSICQVDVAGANTLQIVCGAPNVAIGQKVVVALVDTILYPIDGEAFTIKKSKIRGEASEGMICAEDEIGLGYGHDGILVLDEKLKPGTALAEVFQIKEDFIFEIGLTPNRSDAMSHLGVARDIAAALNAMGNKQYSLKEIPSLSIPKSGKSPISITIEDTEACPRYSGVVVKNLKVEASPSWLQNELLSIGVRPINNVVDVTNYVLKELGQALHAFDTRAITGQEIRVKTLKQGTKFLCLDGLERSLGENDLMICNKSEAMCMAGVFGGLNSGVKEDTTSIFLESAYFNSTTIRKTSTHHSLRTDAAQRYEKGADPDICIEALERACFLLNQIAGGEVDGEIIDVYPKVLKNAEINLRFSRLEQISGVAIALKTIKQILNDLDFEILYENNDSLLLKAPLYRADVLREIDVIEEIMRIFGFNNISIPQQVKSTLSFQSTFDKHALKEKLAHILNGFGFSEIMTNSITQSKYYEEDVSLVRLQNSMTAELDSLRASLIPEALQVIEYNINRKKANLKLFEFGNIYNDKFEQEEQLAIFYTGKVLESNWASKTEKAGIFHLKGIVEAIFENLGIVGYDLSIINDREIYLDKKNLELAKIWELDADDMKSANVEQSVFCARLNWDALISLVQKKKIRFKELSKFPEVSRDLAVILDESISFEAIQQKLKSNASKQLKSIDLFDIFRSEEKIGRNKKSYALNFKLQDSNKTLTEVEIEKTINKIVKSLEQDFDAVIRK